MDSADHNVLIVSDRQSGERDCSGPVYWNMASYCDGNLIFPVFDGWYSVLCLPVSFLRFRVYFFVLNYLSVGAVLGVQSVITFLGYGLGSGSVPIARIMRILSPLNYLQNNVHFSKMSYYNQLGDEVITGVSYRGGTVVASYVIVAVAIYLFAYFAYQKRQIESAGDLLTFRWLQPVFRWGVGACVAYVGAILIASFFDSVLIWISAPLFFWCWCWFLV